MESDPRSQVQRDHSMRTKMRPFVPGPVIKTEDRVVVTCPRCIRNGWKCGCEGCCWTGKTQPKEKKA